MGIASGDSGLLERRPQLIRWLAIAGAAGVAAALTLLGFDFASEGEGDSAPAAVPQGLVVEVLNGTNRPGLARAVTRELRLAGMDVVYFGNGPAGTDSTLILVRRGAAQAGLSIRSVLPLGKVQHEPDSLRLVDVTIVLGEDYPLPATFHP